MRPPGDDAGRACSTARSKKRYRRNRWPLPVCVLLGAAVEVMIVLIGQIGGQRVAVNRIGGDPRQRRILRLAVKRLDLNDQGLIRPEVERLTRNDDLAIEMCVDRHEGSLSGDLFQYASNAGETGR